MDPLASLANTLSADGVRYLVIGVWGANYYAPSGSAMFTTLDRDFFLPADPGNLLATWRVCEANGFGRFAGREPLDAPRDTDLARAIVERRALTRASDGAGTDVDLSLGMSDFDFKTAWAGRRIFKVEGVAIPVARLAHIVESKTAAGREKDRLFTSNRIRRASRTSNRKRSNTRSHTTTFTDPSMSSRVRKITPFAVLGRCRTSTTATQPPERTRPTGLIEGRIGTDRSKFDLSIDYDPETILVHKYLILAGSRGPPIRKGPARSVRAGSGYGRPSGLVAMITI